MLFRRFLLVTMSIAMLGVALLNVLQNTHPANTGYEFGNRLIEWERRDAKQACKVNPKTCGLIKLKTVA